MWLRHFRHKRRTLKFKAFRERYYRYEQADCVEICNWHHAEIHAIYIKIISASVVSNGMLACRLWNWTMANELMEKLRSVCDQWLKVESPGIDPERKREFHNETT